MANTHCGRCGELKTMPRTDSARMRCGPCHRKVGNAWYSRNSGEDRRSIVNARTREWRANRPGWHRPYHLKTKYGLTVEQLQQMIVAQGGRCAICRVEFGVNTQRGEKSGPNVDHCHDTGRVRGLLCHMCNKGLGHFGDDPDRLSDALTYLRRPR